MEERENSDHCSHEEDSPMKKAQEKLGAPKGQRKGQATIEEIAQEAFQVRQMAKEL